MARGRRGRGRRGERRNTELRLESGSAENPVTAAVDAPRIRQATVRVRILNLILFGVRGIGRGIGRTGLSIFRSRIVEIVYSRFLENWDDFVSLALSVVSAAGIYWILKKVFPLVGIGEKDFAFEALHYILIFVEVSLILNFLWRKIRGQK